MKSTLNYRAKNLQCQIEHVPRCPLNKLFVLVVIVVLATTLHSLTHASWLTKTVISKSYLEKDLITYKEDKEDREEKDYQHLRHQLLQKHCDSLEMSTKNYNKIQRKASHNPKIKDRKTIPAIKDESAESPEMDSKLRNASYPSLLNKPSLQQNQEKKIMPNIESNSEDSSQKIHDNKPRRYLNKLLQHRNKRRRMKIKTRIKDNFENLWYNDRSNLIYCGVPKVASTNWKRILHTLQGRLARPDDEPVLGGRRPFKVHTGIPSLQSLPKIERDFRMKNYYSFLFTRHPFERIFSAYRDKIQSGKDIYLYNRYNRIILKMIRKEEFNSETSTPASLTEFIQYIIQIHDSGMAFKMNPHWRPVTLLCSVCKMNYIMIGKMKTLSTDSRLVTDYIFKQTSLDLTLPTKRRYKTNSTALLKEALKTVPYTLLKKLYSVYKSDFNAFGYSTNGFI